MKLFFNYSLDCETPVNTEYTGGSEREPFFHGPDSWGFAERAVRSFVEKMEQRGVLAGTSLFVYPDVARHQQSLYREMADHGVEIGLHLNGLRYSRLRGDKAKWLGAMANDEQFEALRMGREDLAETMGREIRGYRACYGSANRATLGICHEVGFTWTSNATSRHRPEFHSFWSGSWRYVHHASAVSNLICGDLPLVEIPVTNGINTYFDESIRHPLDLRVETPASRIGENREKLRDVIEENVDEMERREVPVRAIIGASHNTSDFCDQEHQSAGNLDFIVRHTQDIAQANGLDFTADSFESIYAYAVGVGSY
jgi:hypothetical protein